MALNAYLRLTGAKQGEIKGSVVQKGQEGKIMVIAFEHGISTPGQGASSSRKAASSLPTGKCQHSAIAITKEIDQSTPLLLSALVNNEKITTWELQFWRPAETGSAVQFYTIKLTNAYIVSIQQEMLDNTYPENVPLKEREHVSFRYKKIEWTWVKGNISAMADW